MDMKCRKCRKYFEPDNEISERTSLCKSCVNRDFQFLIKKKKIIEKQEEGKYQYELDH